MMSEQTDSGEDRVKSLTTPKKRIWVNSINATREQDGEYKRLCIELESGEDRFFKYFRMSRSSFEELHELLRPEISKTDTNYRTAISSRERLTICLRYLATGDSFMQVATAFRVGRTTVSRIIEEVCVAIWKKLQPKYIPTPTVQMWKESETGFRKMWGFPNCIGSIDGKHIKIKSPTPVSKDLTCYKYKTYVTVVLFLIVDPYYKILVVDLGNYGGFEECGVFECSALSKKYFIKPILSRQPLPGSDDPVPYVLIGDEGFCLKKYLMRPYPKAVILKDEKKKRYNDKLDHAMQTVRNVFGIMSENWRVFQKPIECNAVTALDVIKATCCLHNYVRIKDPHNIGPSAIVEQISNNVKRRRKSERSALLHLKPNNQRSKNDAIEIREYFMEYFNKIGET